MRSSTLTRKRIAIPATHGQPSLAVPGMAGNYCAEVIKTPDCHHEDRG